MLFDDAEKLGQNLVTLCNFPADEKTKSPIDLKKVAPGLPNQSFKQIVPCQDQMLVKLPTGTSENSNWTSTETSDKAAKHEPFPTAVTIDGIGKQVELLSSKVRPKKVRTPLFLLAGKEETKERLQFRHLHSGY